MDLILQNKEWLFSGVGVVLFGGIGGYFWKKNSHRKVQQKITSGDSSTNIQGGRDVKVSVGEKKDGR